MCSSTHCNDDPKTLKPLCSSTHCNDCKANKYEDLDQVRCPPSNARQLRSRVHESTDDEQQQGDQQGRVKDVISRLHSMAQSMAGGGGTEGVCVVRVLQWRRDKGSSVRQGMKPMQWLRSTYTCAWQTLMHTCPAHGSVIALPCMCHDSCTHARLMAQTLPIPMRPTWLHDTTLLRMHGVVAHNLIMASLRLRPLGLKRIPP